MNRRVRRAQGMALVTVLWVTAILLILAAEFAVTVQTDTALAASYVRRTQAAWLAEAGFQRALLELRDQPDLFTVLVEDAPEGQPLALRLDSTELEDDTGLGGGRFLVEGFDEAARLNLNTVDEDILRALLPDEPELVDAILDWRDDDEETRAAGAEADYYAGLEVPYTSRNQWFETPAELLLLRTVTPARFFGLAGLSPLASAEERNEVDPNLTPLSELFSTWSFDSNLATSGESRVNVNEADEEELLSQLEQVLSAQDVRRIVDYRDGGGREPEDEDGENELLDQLSAMAPPGSGGSVESGEDVGFSLRDLSAGDEDESSDGPGRGGDADSGIASVAELIRVLDREKMQQVYDLLTVSADSRLVGKINLNTASAEILAALPGMDATLADLIVAERRNQPFETVGDLLRLSEITDEVFEQVAGYLTTRSMIYRLAATGAVGEGNQLTEDRIEAVVLVDLQPSQAAASEAEAEETSAENEPPPRNLHLIYRRLE